MIRGTHFASMKDGALFVNTARGPIIAEEEMIEELRKKRIRAVLDVFVKYLQEKPFSRKETYLAKETHENICCFRCGYVYSGTDTCPKCGYKANQ